MASATADSSKKRSELVATIGENTKRKIGIAFSEYEVHGKFNEQEASPLFSVLPPEIRDDIWAYATAPYEDPNGKFEETAYYYRPGHTARLRTDTALLLTCRRVWLEANALPMLQAEHSFYYHRPAPDKKDPEWTAKLTERNRQNFGHLHLFVQMYAIEGLRADTGCLRLFFLKTPALAGDFQPRLLHVTIRHTDWWNWEGEAPLRLQDMWVKALLDSPDLRSTHMLKLELETLDYKVDQLVPILERIKAFESEEKETHIVDGKPMKTKFVLTREPETYTWEGPANINKQQFKHYADRNTLKYHVVTLTWKLTFPDLPKAFAPTLRRAPRIRPEREANEDLGRPEREANDLGRAARSELGGHLRDDWRHWRLPGERLSRDRPGYRLPGARHQARGSRTMRPPERMLRRPGLDQHNAVIVENWSTQMRELAVQQQARHLAEAERWRAKWDGEGSLLKFVDAGGE
ncbi:hypothetical protein LTR36_003208 [Oleoguttula mirabilis]|uniref:Uncharacterized protein n=1 Tax=Oleoguttula mirabilis TaxID=1507867 RepID=A0AAV9JYU1_9PEZI|nr:hypothetical protein LTR36_003208 [Oleoguttula mirabilis]